MAYRLLINSKDRFAGSSGAFDVTFKEQVEVQDNITYNIYLDTAEIPFTFYNVDARNNKLVLIENGAIHTLTLTSGSYTVDEFKAHVQAVLNANTTTSNTYSLTYNDITGKFTVSVSLGSPSNTQALAFNVQSSAYYLLGFDDGQTYPFTSTLTAPNVQNIQTVYEKLYIRTSLFTNTYDTATGYRSDVLEKVQINNLQPFKDTIYYKAQGNTFKTLFRTSGIDYLTIRITDIRGRELNFNGHDWSLSLIIEPVM